MALPIRSEVKHLFRFIQKYRPPKRLFSAGACAEKKVHIMLENIYHIMLLFLVQAKGGLSMTAYVDSSINSVVIGSCPLYTKKALLDK